MSKYIFNSSCLTATFVTPGFVTYIEDFPPQYHLVIRATNIQLCLLFVCVLIIQRNNELALHLCTLLVNIIVTITSQHLSILVGHSYLLVILSQWSRTDISAQMCSNSHFPCSQHNLRVDTGLFSSVEKRR